MFLCRQAFNNSKRILENVYGLKSKQIADIVDGNVSVNDVVVNNVDEFLDAQVSDDLLFSGEDATTIVSFFYNMDHYIVHDYEPQLLNADDLAKIPRDFSVEFTVPNEGRFIAFIWKRYIPLTFNEKTYSYTVQILSFHDEFSFENGRCCVHAHFSIADGANPVRILLSDHAMCRTCDKCRQAYDTHWKQTFRYVSSRRRYSCDATLCNGLYPAVMSAIAKVVDRYNNPKVRMKDVGKLEVAHKSSSPHTKRKAADPKDRPILDIDVERPFVRTVYKGSSQSTYKGGHHASPKPHIRSGYYRRSSVGSYVLNDEGQFIEVPKGQGDYTYVKPMAVNGVLSEESKGIIVHGID